MFLKNPGELVFAVLVDNHMPKRILISVGSRSYTKVSFSAIGVQKAMSTVAEARSGHRMSLFLPDSNKLEHRIVCVTVWAKSIDTQKCFFVDIAIKASQQEHPLIQMGSLRTLSPECPTNEHESTA